VGDRLAAGDAGDNEREGITRSCLTGGFSQLPNSGEDRFARFLRGLVASDNGKNILVQAVHAGVGMGPWVG
jgi:hypothetical protein